MECYDIFLKTVTTFKAYQNPKKEKLWKKMIENNLSRKNSEKIMNDNNFILTLASK